MKIGERMKEDTIKSRSFRKIPFLYLMISAVWVLVSHRILSKYINYLVCDFIFFIGTAMMLYILISKQLKMAQQSKEEWKVREEQLRFLINTMPEFVCYKDAEGRWIEANSFALELFHLQGVDYRGKKDSELAEFTIPFFKEALFICESTDLEALKSPKPVRVEEVIPQPDGNPLIFDAIKVPIIHEGGIPKGLVVIGRNITERKDAERRLEESQQRYKSLFEQNPDAVFSLDLNGKFMSINKTCELITGYSSQDLLHKDYTVIVCDKDRQVGVDKFRETLDGGYPTYELTIIHKQGYEVNLKVTNVPIVVKNQIVGIFGIAADIKELKIAEELLRKSDRLSVVGQLAAGVAHEIRNPLASLVGFVQLLKEKSKDDHFYYDIMLGELNRINFIVSEFLMLSKPQIVEFQNINLSHLLKNVIAIAETQAIINSIQIILDFKVDHTLIHCEENQIKQVFINILKNAIESMPNGGEIHIEVEKRQTGKVAIRFIDQGCGIPGERIPKLGEPFYSTKEKGMGLGLMVSYKIIEAHHGEIHFTSRLEEGTTVEVVLPMVETASHKG